MLVIHTNSYELATRKIRTIWQKSYEFVRVRSYGFVRISPLVKYVRIAVRSGCINISFYLSIHVYDRQTETKRWMDGWMD